MGFFYFNLLENVPSLKKGWKTGKMNVKVHFYLILMDPLH